MKNTLNRPPAFWALLDRTVAHLLKNVKFFATLSALVAVFSPAPQDLVAKQNFTPGAALNVGTQIHTSPAQFGKVMAETNPRMAVAYHFFNDFDTAPNVLHDIRMTYDGPLALATDYMVFNIKKEEEVKVRMAAIDEDIWPPPSTIPLIPPDVKLQRTFLSEYMKGGRVVHKDVLETVYEQINKLYGTNIPVPD